MSLLLGLICVIFTTNAQSTPSTTTFLTTPSLTVAPFVVDAMEDAMGHQLNISNNVYEWNVSLILHLINETDPTYLYDANNIQLLVVVLPPYVIEQAPAQLLLYHRLCEYMDNTSIEYAQCINPNATYPAVTSEPFDFCIGPLIHTDLPNPVKPSTVEDMHPSAFNLSASMVQIFDALIANKTHPLNACGISCEAGKAVYGIEAAQQTVIDYFKAIGCSLIFIGIVIIVLIQYMESRKKHREKFKSTPLLKVIPYINTASLFTLTFLMTIGHEKITCTQNSYDSHVMEYSFDNPGKGGNAACTIDGVLFYMALLFFLFYTALLCLLIYRQLTAPLNPLWQIDQKWWHIGIVMLVLIHVIVSLSVNAYGGIYPMGVCFVGTNNKDYIMAFTIVQCVICSVMQISFIALSAVALQKEIRNRATVLSQDDRATVQVQDLLKRLILYGVSMSFGGIVLTATAIKFYAVFDDVYADYQRTVGCQVINAMLLEYGGTEMECVRETRIAVFWFVSWVIVAMMGTASQLFLSCNLAVRYKFKRATSMKSIELQISHKFRKAGSASAFDAVASRGEGGKHDSNVSMEQPVSTEQSKTTSGDNLQSNTDHEE